MSLKTFVLYWLPWVVAAGAMLVGSAYDFYHKTAEGHGSAHHPVSSKD
jgi:hypothetical protein